MKTFAARRYRNISLLLIACAVSLFIYSGFVGVLHNPAFISGWTLLGLSLFLMLYNARKKLSMLPIFTSATWLQMHIYLGLLCGFIFLLHIHFRIPNGIFETLLASLFLVVFASGLFGLYITRSFPQKLSRIGENVLFERIPVIRKQIRDSVEEIVLSSIETTHSNTISEFYREHLIDLFSGKKMICRQIFTNESVHDIKEKISSLKRYLNEDELKIIEKIQEHVESRDDIDYQYTRQALLKYWLFVHVPFTYSMIICVLLHLVLTYAYIGGLF